MEPEDGTHWIIRQPNGEVHRHPFEPKYPPVIVIFTSERKAQEYLDSSANCWNCDPAQIGSLVALSASETHTLLREFLGSGRVCLDPASPYPSHAESETIPVLNFLAMLFKDTIERRASSRFDETWN